MDGVDALGFPSFLCYSLGDLGQVMSFSWVSLSRFFESVFLSLIFLMGGAGESGGCMSGITELIFFFL